MAFRLCLVSVLPVVFCVDIPSREVAPDVQMPIMSIGTGGYEMDAAEVITTNWIELGGRGVDTAYIYSNQDMVASAIAATGIDRKDVFITTKIPDCTDAKTYVEKNLQLLNTDYIDLLLIHYPKRGGDCGKVWATLEEYYSRGVLRSIGVSQFRRSDIESLMTTAKVTPHVLQMEHNVLSHDDDTIACASNLNITIEAFSPLGQSGHSADITGNAAIQSIAAAHGVSTYQVALKWILQHDHILTFQSSSKAHQEADADVFGFTLTDEELMILDGLQDGAVLV